MVEESGTAFREIEDNIAKGFFNSWEEIAASPRNILHVQPGDVRYEDINKDEHIDVNDMVPIGYGDIPRIMYCINLGVATKDFRSPHYFREPQKFLVNIRTL